MDVKCSCGEIAQTVHTVCGWQVFCSKCRSMCRWTHETKYDAADAFRDGAVDKATCNDCVNRVYSMPAGGRACVKGFSGRRVCQYLRLV